MSYDKEEVLKYHQGGKVAVKLPSPLKTKDDLCLAYTPGVAHAVKDIAENPEEVFEVTSKSNLVAVVSDGSAVLGLGNIGPEAGLPVMEGKAVLFKHFADIDSIPLCIGKVFTESGRTDAAKDQAQVLGGLQAADHQAVLPELLDHEAAAAVDQHIPAQQAARMTLALPQPPQSDKAPQIPHGLIEKGRMYLNIIGTLCHMSPDIFRNIRSITNSLYRHSHSKQIVCIFSKYLPIKEIAPATNYLTQYQALNTTVTYP